MSGKKYIYQPSGNPNFWNRDTAVGFSVGSLLVGPVVGIVGMIIGGFVGKSRMRDERENGKAVSANASFWNKNTVIGAAVGLYASVIPLVAISFTVAPISAPIIAAVSLLSLAVGTIIGGNQGLNRQHNEYQTAKEWVRNNGGRNYEPGQEHERSNNIAQSTPQTQYSQATEQTLVPQVSAPQMMHNNSQQEHHSDDLKASHTMQSSYQIPEKNWQEAKSKLAESGRKSFVDKHQETKQQSAQVTTPQMG